VTASEFEGWLVRLEEAYPAYEPPPEAIGMTTRYELCFVESYARDIFSRVGRIVDLGCWFGATTAALARGLRDSQVTPSKQVVEAYDLFRWEPWMDRHRHRVEDLDASFEEGKSFLPEVRQLLDRYADLVRLDERDLLDAEDPSPEPIEFLFVDAQKSWALGQSIAKAYFPSLIPGTSWVVQQDFVWYDPTILSVHMLMWHLRDHFEFVHQVPRSCSAVFRCTSRVDPAVDPPPPDFFTPEMIDEAYDWCFQWAEAERLPYLQGAKLLFLLQRGFHNEAILQADALGGSTSDLPADLVGGMHRVLTTQQSRAENAGHGGDAAKIATIAERLPPA